VQGRSAGDVSRRLFFDRESLGRFAGAER